ncbi:hypothetical protein PpBr36_02038 [Pyricularia pennisetigena]|uniref:hypothetical protein n=1 Tax=Pyricularia pennisetigena TaxID=1578925 RepID=UPI001151AFB3|nr:hypothetical protein PpBr36_02038 [Pyricularia pennisetigena]TLS29150.1 hypothetical protein PpBr36_02038 [Pyricularia pennisetigena]
MLNPAGTFVVVITAVLGRVIYSRFYSNTLAARKRALAHIPELRFEKDDTPDRYRTETRFLVRKGYEKYLRHGIPFQMHNPVGELGNQVVLPVKYLEEVKRAPRSLYSFEAFSEELFLLSYIDAPRQTDALLYAAKLDINKNLDHVLNGLWTEADVALKETVPETGQITLPGGALACNIIARTMSYVIVGPTLCRDPEWQRIAIEATFAIVEGAMGVRAKYTPNWRWLARWQDHSAEKLGVLRLKAMELIRPLYKERLAALKEDGGESQRFYDTIFWTMNKRKVDKSLKAIVDQQLFLTLASIHTTAGTLQSILCDWLAHPEYHDEILAEVNEGLAGFKSAGDKWTQQEVAKMKKLDSFMKESTRMNPVGCMTVQRYAQKSHTFHDGFVLPAGTVFQFPADAVHHDPDLFPDPDRFDGYRFLRLREKDPNGHHFGYVSDMNLNWGAGTHACPGRFLATFVLKFAFILLITRYDVRFPQGAGKPGYVYFDNSVRVDPTAQLDIKARS